jgi:hypothetical protein
MIGRRNFLRAAGVAPFAAKKAAEQAASSLSGMSIGGLMQGGTSAMCGEAQLSVSTAPLHWPKALEDRALRAELESIYYERERAVRLIDPDLACLRSLSLSAKIAYQRERNVHRAVNDLIDGRGWWGRFDKLSRKIISL